jgi:type II secretory pathway component PulM
MTLGSHPLIKQGLDRYHGLPVRDRNALRLLALTFALLLVYLLVWAPVYRFLEEGQGDRDRHYDLLQYMLGTQAEVRAAGGVSRGLQGQSLLSQISSSTAKFRIKPNRLQPEGSDGVSVWFDAVSFNDLIRWLEQQHLEGIRVRQIAIDKSEASGIVSARVVLHI